MSARMPLLIALLLSVARAAPAPAAPRPAVLALSPGTGEAYGYGELDYATDRSRQDWQAAGLEKGSHVGWEDLTLDYLKKFNAVVLYDLAVSNPEGPSPAIQKSVDLLREYVQQGGGLFIADAPYWNKKVPTANAILAGTGARIVNELVRDEQNTVKLDSTLTLGWTDAISPSPLTQGVSGLFYGVGFWEPGSPNTTPMEVSADWQALVRGKESAASYVVGVATNETTGPGAVAASPVLVAAREWGQGRIVAWPMSLVYTLIDGYSPLLNGGAVMEGKVGERSSQGAALTFRLLQWLCEPTAGKEGWGGFVAPPAPPKPAAEGALKPEPPLSVKPLHHRNPVTLKPVYEHAYLGLIGAQSTLSSGQDSPEALIAAARQAGYEFLVFSEDLGSLTKEGWDKLVAACQAGTDAKFAAFPGFYYQTQYGAEFVTFGAPGDLSYPQPGWLTTVGGERRLLENNVIVRGWAIVPPVIMVYPHRNPRPLRVNAEFYGFAVDTYEAGKLVDEAQQPYLDLQRESLCLFPAAVHFVKSAAEVAAARGGVQSYIRARSLATVPRSVQGFDNAPYNDPGWQKPAFISSGPEIQWVNVDNWGTADLAYENGDWTRVEVRAASPVGLKEVRLYDNARLWRRFLPGGAQSFSQVVDAYHDCQHVYVAEVVDVKGGTALSWGRMTDAQECWHEMCGDNWNDMTGGKYTKINGGVNTEATWLTGTEFGRSLTPIAALWQSPSVPNQPHGAPTWASLKKSGFVSRFGWSLDYSLDHMYATPGWMGGIYDNDAVVDNPFFRGKMHSRFVVGRTPQPNFTLIEGDVTLVAALTCKGTPGLNAESLEGLVAQQLLPGADGTLTLTAAVPKAPWKYGLLAPNQYVGNFPASGGLFNLGDAPLAYSAIVDRINVGLGQDGQVLPAGTHLTWRVLYTGGSPDRTLLDRVRSEMGLVGPPAYTVTPAVGKVTDTRLFLSLQAENGGFRGVITRADLPLPLAVQISGLNPNWSAGIWYRGENVLGTLEWRDHLQRVVSMPRRYTDKIFRIPVDQGEGFCTVDLDEKNRDVYIGSLFVADNPALGLTLVQDPDGDYVEVHNPTDKPITANVRPGPGFDLYEGSGQRLTVAAGTSVRMEVKVK